MLDGFKKFILNPLIGLFGGQSECLSEIPVKARRCAFCASALTKKK